MDFKHYIFTRYNLGLYTDNPYKIEDPDQYMEKRLPLFINYLRGLKEQTNQNYTALVAVDPNTPLKYLNDIATEVNYIDSNIQLITEPHEEWLRKQQIEARWLITSRLDNDDYYLPAFVEEIQKNFNAKQVVYDIMHVRVKGENATLEERGRNNSPFTTLIEQWTSNPKTIFHGEGHTYLPKYFKCVRLPYNEPLAVCNVHGSNAYYK